MCMLALIYLIFTGVNAYLAFQAFRAKRWIWLGVCLICGAFSVYDVITFLPR